MHAVPGNVFPLLLRRRFRSWLSNFVAASKNFFLVFLLVFLMLWLWLIYFTVVWSFFLFLFCCLNNYWLLFGVFIQICLFTPSLIKFLERKSSSSFFSSLSWISFLILGKRLGEDEEGESIPVFKVSFQTAIFAAVMCCLPPVQKITVTAL